MFIYMIKKLGILFVELIALSLITKNSINGSKLKMDRNMFYEVVSAMNDVSAALH